MTLWIVDASVLLAAEDRDDSRHDDCVRILEGDDPLATLDLALYEVANVGTVAWSDQQAVQRLLARAQAIADDGGIVRCTSSLLGRAAAVAREHGITVYDAAYVAAGEALEASVVSCDVRDLVSHGLAVLPHDAVSR